MPPNGMASPTSCRCCSAELHDRARPVATPLHAPRSALGTNAKRAPKAPVLPSSKPNRLQPPSLLFSEEITATGAAAVAGMPRGSTADT